MLSLLNTIANSRKATLLARLDSGAMANFVELCLRNIIRVRLYMDEPL